MYKVDDIVEFKQLETFDHIFTGRIVAKCKMLEAKSGIKDEIFYYIEIFNGCYPKIVFEDQIVGLYENKTQGR
jgi:hypothetical protein